jgi:hypothetical protein
MTMKKTVFAGILVCLLMVVLVSCDYEQNSPVVNYPIGESVTTSEQDEPSVALEQSESVEIDNSHNNFDWIGVYQGVFSTETGIEIKVQLELWYIESFGGVYELSFEYLSYNQSIPEIGSLAWNEWSERIGYQSGRFFWEDEGNILRLDLGDWPGDWPPFYRIDDGAITLLKLSEGVIVGEIAKLTKVYH